MGADLITHIVVGPVKLRPSKATQQKVLKHADNVLKRAKQAVKLSGWDYDGDDLLGGLGLEPEDMEGFALVDARQTFDNLLKLWKDGKFRDVSSRLATVGGKQVAIVVAGDSSWGDEPDGLGYETLRDAYRLGMLELLGIQ